MTATGYWAIDRFATRGRDLLPKTGDLKRVSGTHFGPDFPWRHRLQRAVVTFHHGGTGSRTWQAGNQKVNVPHDLGRACANVGTLI